MDSQKALSAARNQARKSATHVKAPADLWEQLEALRAPIARAPRPPEAFTCPEYARRFGLAKETAREELIRLVQLGKLKKFGVRPAYYSFNE